MNQINNKEILIKELIKEGRYKEVNTLIFKDDNLKVELNLNNNNNNFNKLKYSRNYNKISINSLTNNNNNDSLNDINKNSSNSIKNIDANNKYNKSKIILNDINTNYLDICSNFQKVYANNCINYSFEIDKTKECFITLFKDSNINNNEKIYLNQYFINKIPTIRYNSFTYKKNNTNKNTLSRYNSISNINNSNKDSLDSSIDNNNNNNNIIKISSSKSNTSNNSISNNSNNTLSIYNDHLNNQLEINNNELKHSSQVTKDMYNLNEYDLEKIEIELGIAVSNNNNNNSNNIILNNQNTNNKKINQLKEGSNMEIEDMLSHALQLETKKKLFSNCFKDLVFKLESIDTQQCFNINEVINKEVYFKKVDNEYCINNFELDNIDINQFNIENNYEILDIDQIISNNKNAIDVLKDNRKDKKLLLFKNEYNDLLLNDNSNIINTSYVNKNFKLIDSLNSICCLALNNNKNKNDNNKIDNINYSNNAKDSNIFYINVNLNNSLLNIISNNNKNQNSLLCKNNSLIFYINKYLLSFNIINNYFNINEIELSQEDLKDYFNKNYILDYYNKYNKYFYSEIKNIITTNNDNSKVLYTSKKWSIRPEFITKIELSSENISELNNLNLFKNLKELNLANNNLRHIKFNEIHNEANYSVITNTNSIDYYNSFNSLTTNNVYNSLIYLNLSTNSIYSIDNNVLVKFNNLLHLNLGFNNLSSIPTLSDSIRYLNLQRNNIKKIENIPNNVIELNLTDNNIEEIENLKQCVYLKTLYLGRNNITSFNNIMEQCFFIEYLYLYNNKITSIPYWLYLPFLIDFDIQNNYICKLSKENQFDVNYNILLCPSLKNLKCQNNKITTIDKGLFSKLYNIKSIDISYNNISNFDCIVNSFKNNDCENDFTCKVCSNCEFNYLEDINFSNNKLDEGKTDKFYETLLKELNIVNSTFNSRYKKNYICNYIENIQDTNINLCDNYYKNSQNNRCICCEDNFYLNIVNNINLLKANLLPLEDLNKKFVKKEALYIKLLESNNFNTNINTFNNYINLHSYYENKVKCIEYSKLSLKDRNLIYNINYSISLKIKRLNKLCNLFSNNNSNADNSKTLDKYINLDFIIKLQKNIRTYLCKIKLINNKDSKFTLLLPYIKHINKIMFIQNYYRKYTVFKLRRQRIQREKLDKEIEQLLIASEHYNKCNSLGNNKDDNNVNNINMSGILAEESFFLNSSKDDIVNDEAYNIYSKTDKNNIISNSIIFENEEENNSDKEYENLANNIDQVMKMNTTKDTKNNSNNNSSNKSSLNIIDNNPAVIESHTSKESNTNSVLLNNNKSQRIKEDNLKKNNTDNLIKNKELTIKSRNSFIKLKNVDEKFKSLNNTSYFSINNNKSKNSSANKLKSIKSNINDNSFNSNYCKNKVINDNYNNNKVTTLKTNFNNKHSINSINYVNKIDLNSNCITNDEFSYKNKHSSNLNINKINLGIINNKASKSFLPKIPCTPKSKIIKNNDNKITNTDTNSNNNTKQKKYILNKKSISSTDLQFNKNKLSTNIDNSKKTNEILNYQDIKSVISDKLNLNNVSNITNISGVSNITSNNKLNKIIKPNITDTYVSKHSFDSKFTKNYDNNRKESAFNSSNLTNMSKNINSINKYNNNYNTIEKQKKEIKQIDIKCQNAIERAKQEWASNSNNITNPLLQQMLEVKIKKQYERKKNKLLNN